MSSTTFKLTEVALKNDSYPKPTGYRILIKTLDISNKTNSGIYLPDSSVQDHRAVASIGRVIAMGPDAYSRDDMSEPWCYVNDYVMFGKYAGHRFKYGEVELRIMNDDEILGLVPDVSEIS